MSTTRNISNKKKQPSITPASTKNKDKALQDVIGIWKNRKDTDDMKAFRKKLWRKTN